MFEKKWGEKEDKEVNFLYRQMGQEHSANLLENLEGSEKGEREMVLAEVDRQRQKFEEALKNDDGQVGWKPIFYDGHAKVHVSHVSSRPKLDGAGSGTK